jgi:anti-sigma28 factor (negative regulator of flagellin synthesis)
MQDDREAAIAKIKDAIAQGKYRIDVQAVAEAILGRLRALAVREPSSTNGHSGP